MDQLLKRFDGWLQDDGPAALVLREHLMPVEGRDGVIFPATFAASAGDGFPGGYNIDVFPDGKNVCLVDSVGSQANRIEPVFASGPYAELVPQVTITAGSKKVNLLEAGHRAGDAIVRCSALQEELREAFREVQKGNAQPLAKIAPTSLVFGAWDSRDTQAKLPRIIVSTIRAYNVRKLTRSAQFVPAAEYVPEGLLDDPSGDKKLQDAYAVRGFIHVPATGSHGGVIADGGIRRDAALHLAALRLLAAGDNTDRTLELRRYILGLALTALTYPAANYLRQGCNLVSDPDQTGEFVEVYGNGRRVNAQLTHQDSLAYARAAAGAFGSMQRRDVEFDKALAKKDVSPDPDGDKGGKKRVKQVKSS